LASASLRRRRTGNPAAGLWAPPIRRWSHADRL